MNVHASEAASNVEALHAYSPFSVDSNPTRLPFGPVTKKHVLPAVVITDVIVLCHNVKQEDVHNTIGIVPYGSGEITKVGPHVHGDKVVGVVSCSP
jgi:hypothetical protein